MKFNVSGTTCASCEVLIERELKKVDGVIGVSVSHARGEVHVDIAQRASCDLDQFNRMFGEHGYVLRHWEEKQDTQSWDFVRLGKVVILTLVVWYLLDSFGLFSISPSVNSSVGLIGIFFIGVVASLSSCTAILSGFIIALSTAHAKLHATESVHDRLRPHILFNLGRVIGFSAFGLLIGYAGSLIVLSPTFNAIFILVVALMMLIIGLHLLDLVPKGFVSIAPPKWMTRKIHALQDSRHPGVPFVLGALTFLLPCGFTQSVQLYALTTGNPITAALIMGIFALGTAPMLMGLGVASSVAHGKTLKYVTFVAGVLVLVIGLAQLQNAATLLGISAPGAVSSQQQAFAADALILADGKQLIQMEVASGFYAPEVLQVVVGIPVEWQIYAPEFMGCADTLISRDLGINTRLTPGENTILFTPTKAGSFTFSCSMGMVRGTMIVVPK